VRLALVAVGSAIVGSAAVLLSVAPPPPPTPAPRAVVTGGEPRVRTLPPGVPASATLPGSGPSVCPPRRAAPLDVEAWRKLTLSSPPPASTWDRASVLSLAFPKHEQIARALELPDPAPRELAALLLNLATDRIVGCRPLARGEGTVTDVLDALDRLVATLETGEPVSHSDLEVATAAARELNEGRGEVPVRGPGPER
jgi:hypothetical protein